MAFSPNTEVYLLSNVPISYEHERDFANASEQANYFLQFAVLDPFVDNSYQREHMVFNCGMRYDSLMQCNYIMYRNQNFTNKWYYGFIERKEYVNASEENGLTRIHFAIDPFQTYMFDYNIKSAFIERCHQKLTDVVGNPNLDNYPEGLDFGHTMKTVYHSFIPSELGERVLIASFADMTEMSSDEDGNPDVKYSGGATYDGVPSAVKLYVASFTATDISDSLSTILSNLKNSPWVAQGIISCTILPREISASLSVTKVHSPIGNGFDIGVLDENVSIPSSSFQLDFATAMPAYKEPKLYTYPYTIVEITNHAGSSVVLQPEYLFHSDPETGSHYARFEKHFLLSAEPRFMMFPANYSSSLKPNSSTDIPTGLDYQCVFGTFPQFAVPIDNYLLYVANTANSFRTAMITNDNNRTYRIVNSITNPLSSLPSITPENATGSALSIGSSASSGIAGSIISHAANEEAMLAQRQDMELKPPSTVGQLLGDAMNFKNQWYGFDIVVKTLPDEYATKIDSYFNCYGTKMMQQNVPNTKSRRYWNFIKASDMVIVGNIPKEHERILVEMYRAGFTIWHTDDIGNYELNNTDV